MTLIPADLRDAVIDRGGNRCAYCQLSQESQVATFPVDHIVPFGQQGPTELSSLALACPRCNSKKWMHSEARDPDTGEIVLLFNPRTQSWQDHFRWSASDPAVLEPLTAAGRATAALLEINSEQHVLVRRLLLVLGMHPGQ